eukprot:6202359-Pleurochrysis_carterae.AAC.2
MQAAFCEFFGAGAQHRTDVALSRCVALFSLFSLELNANLRSGISIRAGIGCSPSKAGVDVGCLVPLEKVTESPNQLPFLETPNSLPANEWTPKTVRLHFPHPPPPARLAPCMAHS